MNTTKQQAHIAGCMYLAVGILGGFAQGYFQPLLYVAGDASSIASNVTNNLQLMPWGVVAELTQATCFVFLALLLQSILKSAGSGRARAMVALVVIASAIMTLNNVFAFGAYRVATDSQYAAALGEAGQRALIYLLLDLQHYGVLIAQVFIGLWLVPLGLLARESALFPRWLGGLLIVGGVCYLINLLTLFLIPDFGIAIKNWIVIPCAAAEISMVLYLLIFGVRNADATRAD